MSIFGKFGAKMVLLQLFLAKRGLYGSKRMKFGSCSNGVSSKVWVSSCTRYRRSPLR